MPEITCPECKVTIAVPPSAIIKGQKYCSRECAKINKSKPNVKCSECNIPLKRKPGKVNKCTDFFCSDNCQSVFKLRKTGSRLDKITDSKKRLQKKRLRRERGDICEVCNWAKGPCDVHHIIPVSKGGSEEDSNLIILCPNCHRLAHSGELTLDNKTS